VKNFFILTGLILISIPELAGQRKYSGIDNVWMDIVDNKVLIHYNINDAGEDDLHNISIRFISDAQELVMPYHLGGDVGPGIRADGEKTIVWNVTEDMSALNRKLSPLIISDMGLSSQKIGSGPGNALLSVFVPGLGDYFVANRREMKFKPLYRTLIALGCTSLGTYAALNRSPGEPLYSLSQDQTIHHYNDKPSTPTYSYKFYGYGDTEYAFFKGDAEILLATGIAVWLYDVIWVYSKGSLNRKLKASMKTAPLTLSPLPGGAKLSCVFTF
jgi:hypothetical protein